MKSDILGMRVSPDASTSSIGEDPAGTQVPPSANS